MLGQDRHWRPYIGPRSPFSSAHSFEMETPFSLRYWILVSPRKNHSSSWMMDFKWHFFVVISGKPSDKSKRIWYPNMESVPVPVRSDFLCPCSSTCCMSSRYWRIEGG